ncbi:MAG: putative SOS response-associated peptidase YedK [Algoriphagus sp.]|jgi:putative SOS response-associated peptidase YedK
MCRDVSYSKSKEIKYAKRLDMPETEIKRLEKELANFERRIQISSEAIDAIQEADKDLAYLNLYTHPELPTKTNKKRENLQYYQVGLIPRWEKDAETAKIRRRGNINARSETAHNKPSFREALEDNRCLIVVDGFYEYYHHHNGRKIPFYVSRVDDEPLVLAGIWEETNVGGELIKSSVILTTSANTMMAKIHNSPKNGGRMPVIIESDQQDNWLDGTNLKNIYLPAKNDILKAYTVRPITKKESEIKSEPRQEFTYKELRNGVDSIRPDSDEPVQGSLF